MRIAIGMGVGMQRRASAPDVTAPVINSLVIDDTTDPIGVSFSITEGADVYGVYTNSAESYGPTDGDLIIAGKLADGVTDAPLSFGPLSVTAPVVDTTTDTTTLGVGTKYLTLVARDAALNISAPVTGSFTNTVPATSPDVTSVLEEVSGAYNTLNVDIGATTASDSIFIVIASTSGTALFSAPNFTVISDSQTLQVNNRPVVLKWDGTGTRPNSTTVTVTATPGHTFNAMSMVISGTTVTAATNLLDATTEATSTGPTITAADNSIVVHIFAGPSDATYAYVNTTPTPAPTKDAYIGNLPAKEIFGFIDVGSGGSLRSLLVITDEQLTAGTSTAATLTSAFGFTGQWISFGVSP